MTKSTFKTPLHLNRENWHLLVNIKHFLIEAAWLKAKYKN